MDDEGEKLHWLILRQLKRANISADDIHPSKKKEWYDFLERINRTYSDHEQERYLLERSMDISSREMAELNEKLETAQKIAHLGYWFYDREEDKLTWSDETFLLMGIDPFSTPTLQKILALVHEQDRSKLKSLIDRAFSDGQDYELELRLKNEKKGIYAWHYAKGHPHIEYQKDGQKKPIRYLSGITMDITKRKLAEEDMNNMHQQLLSISRQAGMAEVATSVLHNIGNVLNSANVSISILHEIVAHSHVTKLLKLSDIIKEHIIKNDGYLIEDESGKLIPDYLIALSKDIQEEINNISDEIINIDTQIKHIKDIVALQKDISGIAGIKENILLNEVIDLAIQMGFSSEESKEIEIIKIYQYNDYILSEKAKLLQIILNLIRNARDSVLSSHHYHKVIVITTKKSENAPSVEIIVSDNGTGISHENITRIFSFGFTTKQNGHGFGLHSSAISANELGGSLRAESKGIGQGAIFTITLPLIEKRMQKKQVIEESET